VDDFSRESYCKELNPIEERNAVGILDPTSEIGRGIESGKGSEVRHKMRLVKIYAGINNVRPLHTVGFGKALSGQIGPSFLIRAIAYRIQEQPSEV
jgi:hypothetical protein